MKRTWNAKEPKPWTFYTRTLSPEDLEEIRYQASRWPVVLEIPMAGRNDSEDRAWSEVWAERRDPPVQAPKIHGPVKKPKPRADCPRCGRSTAIRGIDWAYPKWAYRINYRGREACVAKAPVQVLALHYPPGEKRLCLEEGDIRLRWRSPWQT